MRLGESGLGGSRLVGSRLGGSRLGGARLVAGQVGRSWSTLNEWGKELHHRHIPPLVL